MVKGHNKRDGNNDPNQLEKATSEHRHLDKKKRSRIPVKGRNAESDPSEGRKKKNNV